MRNFLCKIGEKKWDSDETWNGSEETLEDYGDAPYGEDGEESTEVEGHSQETEGKKQKKLFSGMNWLDEDMEENPEWEEWFQKNTESPDGREGE